MGKRMLDIFVHSYFHLLYLFLGVIILVPRDEMKAAEKLISELKAAGGDNDWFLMNTAVLKVFWGMLKGKQMIAIVRHARDFATRSKSAAEAGLAAIKKK